MKSSKTTIRVAEPQQYEIVGAWKNVLKRKLHPEEATVKDKRAQSRDATSVGSDAAGAGPTPAQVEALCQVTTFGSALPNQQSLDAQLQAGLLRNIAVG